LQQLQRGICLMSKEFTILDHWFEDHVNSHIKLEKLRE
jgi:hypothetical protein